MALGQSASAARPEDRWDVVVIGGGNAALVAAISAREQGRSVLMLERAPREFRGGNTRHTRTIRCVHAGPDEYCSGSYLFEELWADLSRTGSGPSNEKLAALTIRASETLPGWMSEHGVRWQHALSGTLHFDRTNRFFLGGGKALVNTYYRLAEKMGIQVRYETTATGLVMEDHTCIAIQTTVGLVRAGAVVCASGGYEANIGWLRRYWGDAVDNYIVRGPKYNDGIVLESLYENGAQSAGQKEGFHAIAVDARSPRFDGGIATRLDSVPFSIVVNRDGVRFYDEGEDIWPKRYAIWGGLIAAQPGQIAYSIWDAKASGTFLPPMYPPYSASSIEYLAELIGLPAHALRSTVAEYNEAVQPGTFDKTRLDGCGTDGLVPPKSHWAQTVDEPPFFASPLRPGITFTYMGVAITEEARVRRKDGTQFANVFAAGEIMSGNVLSTGYLGGFGLSIGTVWGRIAGREAAAISRG